MEKVKKKKKKKAASFDDDDDDAAFSFGGASEGMGSAPRGKDKVERKSADEVEIEALMAELKSKPKKENTTALQININMYNTKNDSMLKTIGLETPFPS